MGYCYIPGWPLLWDLFVTHRNRYPSADTTNIVVLQYQILTVLGPKVKVIL